MKIKLSLRETIISFTSLLVVLYFFFDFFLYSPKLREQPPLKTELSSIDQKLQETAAFLTGGTQVELTSAGWRKGFPFMRRNFQPEKTLSSFWNSSRSSVKSSIWKLFPSNQQKNKRCRPLPPMPNTGRFQSIYSCTAISIPWCASCKPWSSFQFSRSSINLRYEEMKKCRWLPAIWY